MHQALRSGQWPKTSAKMKTCPTFAVSLWRGRQLLHPPSILTRWNYFIQAESRTSFHDTLKPTHNNKQTDSSHAILGGAVCACVSPKHTIINKSVDVMKVYSIYCTLPFCIQEKNEENTLYITFNHLKTKINLKYF